MTILAEMFEQSEMFAALRRGWIAYSKDKTNLDCSLIISMVNEVLSMRMDCDKHCSLHKSNQSNPAIETIGRAIEEMNYKYYSDSNGTKGLLPPKRIEEIKLVSGIGRKNITDCIHENVCFGLGRVCQNKGCLHYENQTV